MILQKVSNSKNLWFDLCRMVNFETFVVPVISSNFSLVWFLTFSQQIEVLQRFKVQGQQNISKFWWNFAFWMNFASFSKNLVKSQHLKILNWKLAKFIQNAFHHQNYHQNLDRFCCPRPWSLRRTSICWKKLPRIANGPRRRWRHLQGS